MVRGGWLVFPCEEIHPQERCEAPVEEHDEAVERHIIEVAVEYRRADDSG